MTSPALLKARIRTAAQRPEAALVREAIKRTLCPVCYGTRKLNTAIYDEHDRFCGTRLVPCPECQR